MPIGFIVHQQLVLTAKARDRLAGLFVKAAGMVGLGMRAQSVIGKGMKDLVCHNKASLSQMKASVLCLMIPWDEKK